jgi:hypothetical protein
MSKLPRCLAFVVTLGMVAAGCGGGGYSAEVTDRFMAECTVSWDDPFCNCALDYFESQGSEDWFKSTTWSSPQQTDFSEPGAWLVGVPGFALIECQDQFQG